MLEQDLDRLRPIGMTPRIAAALATSALAGTPMRVTAVHRETVDVHDGSQLQSARLLPALARALAEAGDALAVGDWAGVQRDSTGDAWLLQRLPPLTRLARRRDGDHVLQPLVTNVDLAFVVMGLGGDFNPRRVERFIALTMAAGVQTVVVLTRADTVAAPAAALADLRERLPASVPLHAVNALDPAAAVELAPYLAPGITAVLLGTSGAGKSTLTNTLLGDIVQDTGAVRAGDERGRHTTTARSLHQLPGGACVIDTPGVRALALALDAEALSATFTDVVTLAQQCRFRDCSHQSEPGCAVLAAVPPDRLANYRKLLREARRGETTVLECRRVLAGYKVRARAVRQKRRLEP